MAGEKAKPIVIDAQKLASLLRSGVGATLVIDSRSFVEYNTSHVLNSVNICCSKLVKRRLQQDKFSIAELIQPSGKMKMLPDLLRVSSTWLLLQTFTICSIMPLDYHSSKLDCPRQALTRMHTMKSYLLTENLY
ncbi:dual specificity protein phosphatase 8-like isoform X1 [Rhincodon typus]|uniref:dual specificity protein phosphatase 8-like isoform X1 n=1 Tax=Rhincodon typus TaxID=259920 RepID=UPI002030E1F6|nr:dual specificity protein phosphatase 8-like isoform X1 [Rhincodon typus]